MTITEFFAFKRSRHDVAQFFNCSDRLARRKIAQLQETYDIVNLQDGSGYFIAPNKEVLQEYAVQEFKRAVEIMRKARKLLKRANVDESQLEWDGEDAYK